MAYRLILALLALLVLLTAFQAQAECYDWPLRVGYQGRIAYDGDTIYVTMPGLPPEISAMSVRINGIDTPEIRGKCQAEKDMAVKARDYVLGLLSAAKTVQFCNPQWGKYAGRVVADVKVDGKLLSELLIENSLGRPYDGGKREGWCE